MIVIPLFIVGVIAYARLESFSHQTVIEQMETLMNQVQLHIQARVQTARANVELFSKSSLLENHVLIEDEGERYMMAQPALLRLFASYQRAYPDYYEIRVLLPDGYEDTRSIREAIPNDREEEGNFWLFQDMAASQDVLHSTFFRNPDNNEMAYWTSKKLLLSDPTY